MLISFECNFMLQYFLLASWWSHGAAHPPVKMAVHTATVETKSVEKCTFYNKKVETNSISFFFFFYEYKVSCKYVQSVELVLEQKAFHT